MHWVNWVSWCGRPLPVNRNPIAPVPTLFMYAAAPDTAAGNNGGSMDAPHRRPNSQREVKSDVCPHCSSSAVVVRPLDADSDATTRRPRRMWLECLKCGRAG